MGKIKIAALRRDIDCWQKYGIGDLRNHANVLALIDLAEAAHAYSGGTLPLDPRIDHPVEHHFRETLNRFDFTP